MFGMVIDNGPKFYGTISTLVHELKVKDLEILCHRILTLFNFNGKVFSSVFVKPLMDLIPVWHGDRYWSKILRLYVPRVKVIYLKFLCKCFVFNVSFGKILIGFDSWLA